MTTLPPSLFWKITHTRLWDLLRGKLTSNLDWHTPIQSANLPQNLKTCTLTTVKRTRLWRSEKRDVAHELIAHFCDGIDAGLTPQLLLQNFGDPATAAKLIRRAKIRNRPLLWHLTFRTLQASIALCALYLLLILWFTTREPVIAINYLDKLNARLSSPNPDDQAWPIYRDLWIKYAFGAPASDRNFPDFYHTDPHDGLVPIHPGDPLWPPIETFLNRNQPLIEGLRQAASKPAFGGTLGEQSQYDPQTWRALYADTPRPPVTFTGKDQTQLFTVVLLFPGLLNFSATQVHADMDLAAHRSEPDRYIADFQASLGLARHASQDGFLITRSSSASRIITNFNNRLSFTLNTTPEFFSDAQLHQLLALLQAQRDLLTPDCTTEQWAVMDTLQRYYTDDGHGSGSPTSQGLWQLQAQGRLRAPAFLGGNPAATTTPTARDTAYRWVLHPVLSFVLADRKDATEQAQLYFLALRRDAAKPLWELLQPDSSLSVEFGRQLHKSPLRYPLLSHWLGNNMHSLVGLKITQACSEALSVAIALELYKRKYAKYPTTLTQLTPEFLPQTPIDHSTGLPLLVRYENSKPILYGRGRDAQDDGGILPILLPDQHQSFTRLPPPGPNQPKDWILYPIITRPPQ